MANTKPRTKKQIEASRRAQKERWVYEGVLEAFHVIQRMIEKGEFPEDAPEGTIIHPSFRTVSDVMFERGGNITPGRVKRLNAAFGLFMEKTEEFLTVVHGVAVLHALDDSNFSEEPFQRLQQTRQALEAVEQGNQVMQQIRLMLSEKA